MAEIFDHIAHEYDDWYKTPLGATVDRVERELVWEMLDPQPGQELLDLGCGTGLYAIDLARQGLRVTGLDISSAMLEKAREKSRQLGLDINFIQGDATCLPFADQTFDSILSVTAFEFITEPEKFLREALRVVKIGGKVVIGVIGGDSPWSAMYEEKARKGHPIFKHAKFYTPEEFKELLPDKLVEVKTALYFPPDPENFQVEKALEAEKKGRALGSPGAGFVCGLWKNL
ncbi:MAG: class I SAM-dependent methyltransferase [Bacillota bacterium]|jgi:ubiquinone/menaquinone biosynthesis C-methylase UbiE